MTFTDFQKLPIGTRVWWNRKGQHHGNEGQIAMTRDGRIIQWDDGEQLSGGSQLRWVKRIRFARAGLEVE